MVTYEDHTRLLAVGPGGGGVWLVDPLHPRPERLRDDDDDDENGLPSGKEFAGVLLTRQDAPSL